MNFHWQDGSTWASTTGASSHILVTSKGLSLVVPLNEYYQQNSSQELFGFRSGQLSILFVAIYVFREFQKVPQQQRSHKNHLFPAQPLPNINILGAMFCEGICHY